MSIISEAKLAELQAEYPGKKLKVLVSKFDGEDFEVVATIPTRTQLERSLAEEKSLGILAGAIAIVIDCVIFPDAAELLEEKFLPMAGIGSELLMIAGAGQKAFLRQPGKPSTKRGKTSS
jgi:hypothetical protein